MTDLVATGSTAMATFPTERPWWEPGVIYQVYPRSFQDSNGDGIGDLPGILRRLDYLEWLGVDAIWLSPIFPSPMADFGYDVSDYCDVHPMFGSLADLDRLVSGAHRRGMKVLLDFVPNHTSDRHPWFVESRSSRSNPRRDWYLWADPGPNGGPPTNWASMFGGSAWTFDEPTGQYYYHAFLAEQPDLNWRNREVRQAMMDVLRFWLERGIDGFRIDVIWHVIKDDRLRDNPPARSTRGATDYAHLVPRYTTDRPEVHDVVALMRRTVDAYGDRLLVGELYLPLRRLMRYYGTRRRSGVQLPYNFELLFLPWRARRIAAAVSAYEAALPPGAWPNWVLGNHDQPRIATKVGRAQARVAAMLLLTLRGTPTIYNGDEIGMVNGRIPPDRLVDPARHDGRAEGRDPERTPMQWDGGPRAGFTTGEPWLPIAADADVVNVAAQAEDPRSMLTLHRRLLALRRAETALSIGGWDLHEASGPLLTYLRSDGRRRVAIALNLGPRPVTASLPGEGTILLSTALDRDEELVRRQLYLRGDEGVAVALREPGG
ncbi:MAG TPA: alpha-amylase family glycosyl hydrolase [Candidatus Limnocylindrales bacterium]